VSELSLQQYNAYVDTIYAAATVPDSWKHFLELVSDAFLGARVALHGHDLATGHTLGALSHGYDPDYIAVYEKEYSAINPWTGGYAKGPIGRVQLTEDLIDAASLKKTRFYDEWIRPQGDIGTGVGITICRDSSKRMRLSCNVSFRNGDRLRTEMVQTLTVLAPHLRRSFEIGRRLQGRALGMGFEPALDKISSAVFLLDAHMRIRYANRAAETMLSCQDCATSIDKRLVFLDKDANRRFGRSIHAATKPDYSAFEGQIRLRNAGGDTMMEISVVPLVRTVSTSDNVFEWMDDTRASVMVCVQQTGPLPKRRQVKFTNRYGLTPTEALLAEELLRGSTLKLVAQERGVSIHTVRNQLKVIFEKTGTSQQSQLVALLAKG
jgi:DNA-binding CsgD family transcriptional regulator/PAS domain-containing protein